MPTIDFVIYLEKRISERIVSSYSFARCPEMKKERKKSFWKNQQSYDVYVMCMISIHDKCMWLWLFIELCVLVSDKIF